MTTNDEFSTQLYTVMCAAHIGGMTSPKKRQKAAFRAGNRSLFGGEPGLIYRRNNMLLKPRLALASTPGFHGRLSNTQKAPEVYARPPALRFIRRPPHSQNISSQNNHLRCSGPPSRPSLLYIPGSGGSQHLSSLLWRVLLLPHRRTHR